MPSVGNPESSCPLPPQCKVSPLNATPGAVVVTPTVSLLESDRTHVSPPHPVSPIIARANFLLVLTCCPRETNIRRPTAYIAIYLFILRPNSICFVRFYSFPIRCSHAMARNPKIIPKDRLLVQTASYNTNLLYERGRALGIIDLGFFRFSSSG